MSESKIKNYFDWAATSKPDNKILQEALDTTLKVWANPSSIHSQGKASKNLLENARDLSAKVLGVSSDTLFFTSGGTESNQIALLSVLKKPKKGRILISSIEHPSIREQAEELKTQGWKIDYIPATNEGIITSSAVREKMTDDTVLVCVMAVNNETGAIQPIKEIAQELELYAKGKRKAKLHVDCVQAAGKIQLSLIDSKIDSASFSAHKICGPRGSGILYVKDQFIPFLKGGGQEKNIRSGTENVYGAIAFSKCLEKYFITSTNKIIIERYEEQKRITKSFLLKLKGIKTCTIIPEQRLDIENNFSPWIVQASFKNIPGEVMVRALDADGFYISTGSACSSRKSNRLILNAMNIPPTISENAVRFSFGVTTTEEEIDNLAKKIKEIAERFS